MTRPTPKHNWHSSSRLLLAAAFVLWPLGAQAAQGFRVDEAQQALVSRGMSAEQVREVLGQHTQQVHYRNQPGPTLTYKVIGKLDTVFEVDFDANGQVESANERVIPIDGDSAFDR